jgi:hypothetical protein
MTLFKSLNEIEEDLYGMIASIGGSPSTTISQVGYSWNVTSLPRPLVNEPAPPGGPREYHSLVSTDDNYDKLQVNKNGTITVIAQRGNVNVNITTKVDDNGYRDKSMPQVDVEAHDKTTGNSMAFTIPEKADALSFVMQQTETEPKPQKLYDGIQMMIYGAIFSMLFGYCVRYSYQEMDIYQRSWDSARRMLEEQQHPRRWTAVPTAPPTAAPPTAAPPPFVDVEAGDRHVDDVEAGDRHVDPGIFTDAPPHPANANEDDRLCQLCFRTSSNKLLCRNGHRACSECATKWYLAQSVSTLGRQLPNCPFCRTPLVVSRIPQAAVAAAEAAVDAQLAAATAASAAEQRREQVAQVIRTTASRFQMV